MKHEVPDRKGRKVQFEGELLAKGSSDDGKVQRWSETELYRTREGRYVIHTVGRSTVYHALDSRCTRFAKEVNLAEELEEQGTMELSACRRCSPPLAEGTSVLLEQPRHNVIVIDRPRGVVERLHARDDDGVEFLTKLSREVLEAASAVDSDLAAAWNLRVV